MEKKEKKEEEAEEEEVKKKKKKKKAEDKEVKGREKGNGQQYSSRHLFISFLQCSFEVLAFCKKINK